MNGAFAQVVALAAHGDAWLRTGGTAPELFPGHSTFHHTRRVAFAWSEPFAFLRRRDPQSATGAWYTRMRDRGASALKVATWRQQGALADHVGVAFQGYTLWGVLAAYEGSWQLWVPESSGYSVIYRCRAITAPPAMVRFDEADSQLQTALEAATRFARQAGQDSWVKGFAEAIALREAPDPKPPYHPDLLPEQGYSPEARRLLACAVRAWVFGGMGSWNDLVFRDAALETEYERVTPWLFGAVLDAIAAAANAGQA